MSQPIPITLPDDLRLAVVEIARSEGVDAETVIAEAVRQHVFLRRFRSLRERLAVKAQYDGPFTDEEVFNQVS
jgi:predicted transcriptional regulator